MRVSHGRFVHIHTFMPHVARAEGVEAQPVQSTVCISYVIS